MLVGVWLYVSVLSAGVERERGGVVASALLFDLVEVGERQSRRSEGLDEY